MSARPEPMLLENGDLLVPDERGTEMVKLKPGDEGHAEWLAHLQRQRRAPEPRDREERATPIGGKAGRTGRTAAGCGLGFIAAIAVVAVLLVVAVFVILSLVGDVNLPEIPGLPEDVPEDVPGGFIGHIARI